VRAAPLTDGERAPAPAPLARGPVETAAQALLRALWGVVVPGLLAMLALRYLVPPFGTGVRGAVAIAGNRYALVSGVALFLLFSWMARVWRFAIPGGRHASALPPAVAPLERDGARLDEWAMHAALYARFASARAWARASAALGEVKARDVGAHLGVLRAALLAGDLGTARTASREVEELAAPALGAAKARQARQTWITVASVAAAAVVALIVRTTLFQPYEVLTASMLPTLEPGDVLAASKVAYGGALPHRGDVIVFRSSTVPLRPDVAVPDVLVKRVIGLPGDRITVNRGIPVINGWTVPTCDAGDYLYIQAKDGTMFHSRLRVEFMGEHAYLTAVGPTVPFDEGYVVKPGEVFVLGDNRSSSLDSRAWNEGHGGGVPAAGIAAQADRFLVGTHRSGEADWSRFLRPLDDVATHLHVEGVDERAIEQGIEKCLQSRPKDTSPPLVDELRANRPSRVLGT
jgi:signal peptidase I